MGCQFCEAEWNCLVLYRKSMCMEGPLPQTPALLILRVSHLLEDICEADPQLSSYRNHKKFAEGLVQVYVSSSPGVKTRVNIAPGLRDSVFSPFQNNLKRLLNSPTQPSWENLKTCEKQEN